MNGERTHGYLVKPSRVWSFCDVVEENSDTSHGETCVSGLLSR